MFPRVPFLIWWHGRQRADRRLRVARFSNPCWCTGWKACATIFETGNFGIRDKKSFDCVEMKCDAQEQIYNEIKGMSEAEELVYWKKRERTFRQEISKAKKGNVRKQYAGRST